MALYAHKPAKSRPSQNRQTGQSSREPNREAGATPSPHQPPGMDAAQPRIDLRHIPVNPAYAVAIQPKLALTEPGDTYEREADRVAGQVMKIPAHPSISSTPLRIQRYGGESGGRTDTVPASVPQALAAPGTAMAPALRRDMESRFGHDFSRVRLHSGALAGQSARDLNARAYTLGNDIVFGAGAFQPDTHAGRRLLAHELTHVVQQGGGATGAGAPGKGTIMRMKEGEAPTENSADADVPEWVMSILGDSDISLKTKLRAMATGFGWIGPEPKSEDEFIKDLPAEQPAKQPGEGGLSSDEAAKKLPEAMIRTDAVREAKEMMGADWHALPGSAAYKKSQKAMKGDPQKFRDKALTGGMVWAYENKDKLLKIKAEALSRFAAKKNPKDKETADAADALLSSLSASVKKPLAEQESSLENTDAAEEAWKSIGSEKTKKSLQKVGFPIAWFTTCVTLVNPVAEAAGVDTKKWGPLEMFDKKKKVQFEQNTEAWVPAERKQQPKPGDIIMFVTYPKGQKKGEVQREMSKAFFEHVGILIEPVTANEDKTEKWVTADGGKGFSHRGEDKTGTTVRRYNPTMLQFIPESQTNLQEAAEGGRYLLGFWDITKLPRAPENPAAAPVPAKK